MLNDIFLNNLPSIDLHGLDSDMARISINDFINENIKLKNKRIVIIHGIGKGILKEVARRELNNNRYVTNYKICYFNAGITIVDLIIGGKYGRRNNEKGAVHKKFDY